MQTNMVARFDAREYRRKSFDEPAPNEITAALARIKTQCTDWTDRNEDRIQTISERLQDLEQRQAADGKWKGSSLAPGAFDASALIQSEGFARFQSGAQDRTGKMSLGIATKALLNYTEATTTGTSMPVRPDRLPGFHGFALRPLRLLDFMRVRPVTASAADFLQLNCSGNAEVQEVEGEEKAEMNAEGELMQARVATIAVHTTASAQVLADNEALSLELQRIMGHKVLDRAERQLLVGSGVGQNIDGLYTQAVSMVTYEDSIPDRIGAGLNAMETAGYTPDVVLMHPADWFAIAILKDADGQYLYGSPTTPARPSLWNRPVVTTASVPAGTALIGDSSAVEILEREPPSAIISRDHLNYRVRNLVLILVECRLGLALYDRLAFRRVSLGIAT